MSAVVTKQVEVLKGRYEDLSEKDRRAVVLLSVFLAIVLFYLLVWEPVANWNEASKKQFIQSRDNLEWMLANKDEASRLSGRSTAIKAGDQPLTSLVPIVARQEELSLNQVRPDSSGLVVQTEQVSFTKLIKLLATLNNEYGIRADQFRVDAVGPGEVKAFIHFSR